MRRTSWALAAILAFSGSASVAQMTDRLPSQANAVATIDVQAVLQSGFAEQQGWRSTMTRDGAERPLAVPANATRVTTAALVDLNTMQPAWQASLIETATPLNLEQFAAAKGGYVDTIEGRQVARARNGTYFAQQSPGVVAVLWPANRQVLARWMRSASKPVGLESSLSSAISSGDAYAVAIDLSNAYSTAGVFQAIRNGGFPSLDKYEGDIAGLSESLASIEALKFSARFASAVQGEITATFAMPVDALGPYAKALALDAITEAGFDAAEFDRWTFSAVGNEIKGYGPTSLNLLRHISAIFMPPTPPAALSGEPVVATSQDPQKAMAEASAAYYKSVSQVIDNLNLRQPSLQQSGAYLRMQALRIDRLPALNVDPMLLDWAASITEALNRGAQECITGGSEAYAATQGIMLPSHGSSYDHDGYYSTSDSDGSQVEFRNMQQQKRQAAAQERASTVSEVTTMLNEVFANRTEVRKQMVQKYGVEF